MEGGDGGEHLQWSYCLLPHAHRRGGGGRGRKMAWEEGSEEGEKGGLRVGREGERKGRYGGRTG